MSEKRTKVAFVVATKDRPRELARLIRSLEAQTRLPDEVIVVDGGSGSVEAFCRSVRAFPVRHVRGLPPSASRQRNLGLETAPPDAGLIGFLDDDVVVGESALEKILAFFEGADGRIGGAAFNMLNHPPVAWPRAKLSPYTEAVGLYSRSRGAVSPAGFQTMIGQTWSTVYVHWLPTGASVWRKEVFGRFRFDEWFEGYSYLEDLDFSYRVGKAFRLAVVAEAGYYHLPAASGRGNDFEFGRREVLNRVHFVRKNPELSVGKCYLALASRLLMSLGLALRERDFHHVRRAWGNVIGLCMSIGKIGSPA